MLRPYFLAVLAEAYRKVDRTEEGLTMLAEALTVAEKTGEYMCEAELYRLKEELLLTQSTDHHAAEACFCQSFDITRRQQAKSWELRTAISLSRL